MRTSRRITYEDRCQMYALHQAGSTQAEIGMAWGFSQGTSRALSRNKGPRKPGADPAAGCRPSAGVPLSHEWIDRMIWENKRAGDDR
jgi:hypothetical protein